MAQFLLHELLQLTLWLVILAAAFPVLVAVSGGRSARFSLRLVCYALIGCALYLIILPHL